MISILRSRGACRTLVVGGLLGLLVATSTFRLNGRDHDMVTHARMAALVDAWPIWKGLCPRDLAELVHRAGEPAVDDWDVPLVMSCTDGLVLRSAGYDSQHGTDDDLRSDRPPTNHDAGAESIWLATLAVAFARSLVPGRREVPC